MSDRVYAVVRRGCRPDASVWEMSEFLTMPEGNGWGEPVAVFNDPASADAMCRELEIKGIREIGSPGRFGDLGNWTWDEAILWENIRLLGIETPVPIETYDDGSFLCDWPAWWETVLDTCDEEQVIAVWDLAEELRLYEVRELELGD